MADVIFKDLCLDAQDPDALARFWAPTLGLDNRRAGDGRRLTDAVDEHTVWVNRVPEPRTVKHRVHLDVHVRAVDDVVRRGARVLDDTQRWTVLADPEDGELCAFVRPPSELPDYRLYEVVIDSVDPRRIASWWAEQFGLEPDHEEGASGVGPGAGLPWELVFGAVPEPKTVKNRIHWDVVSRTADVLAAGAVLLTERSATTPWDVLADPEGNEFCVFPPD